MRIYILIIVTLVITGCGNLENHSPVPNAKPKNLLHVFGEKSSSLSVEIVGKYQAANSDCDSHTNWPMTVSLPRVVSVEIPVKESAESYEALVPLDYFEEGSCKWLPFSINYTVKKGDVALNMPIPPVPLVWIATPGNTNSWMAREGAHSLPTFDVSCQQYTRDNKTNIACNVPLGKYSLWNDAKEIHANFMERRWFSVPFHN
jgi:hypothetical protein